MKNSKVNWYFYSMLRHSTKPNAKLIHMYWIIIMCLREHLCLLLKVWAFIKWHNSVKSKRQHQYIFQTKFALHRCMIQNYYPCQYKLVVVISNVQALSQSDRKLQRLLLTNSHRRIGGVTTQTKFVYIVFIWNITGRIRR